MPSAIYTMRILARDPSIIPGYVQLRSVSVNSRVGIPSYERIKVDVIERQ
jgi:hypothetical protein